MATISPFRSKPPPAPSLGTAARAALAEAIAAHAEAEANLTAANAAANPASQAVWAATRAVEEATTALAEAKTAAARHLTDVARGIAGEPPRSIKDARVALQDAEDTLEAAREARDALKVHLPEYEAREAFTKGRLRDAALAVLRAEAAPMADALVAELTEAQRTVATKGAALEWLVREGMIEASNVPAAPGSFNMVSNPAKLALSRHRSPPQTWQLAHAEMTTAGPAPWQAALIALQRDAAAELPT